jgi:hypothetical protein
MKVVMPWTERYDPHSVQTLIAHTPHAGAITWARVDVDDEAYWRLLSDLWTQHEDFVIVEHDIEIHSDVLPAFESCTAPWCVNAYFGQPYKRYPVPLLRVALGCVRFRGEFTAKYPNILEGLTNRHWRRLDSLIATRLQQYGERAHEHEPNVVHHHDYEKNPSTPPRGDQRRIPLVAKVPGMRDGP